MFMKFRSKLFIFLFFSFLTQTGSGFADTLNDTQAWSALIAKFPVADEGRFFGYFEAQPRVGDNVRELERLLVRPAIGYKITPDLSVLLGYGWTPTFMNNKYESDFRDETRIWEQLSYNQHSVFDLFEIEHRFRQEQRFIQHVGNAANRSRYMLKGSLPLNADKNFGLTGYDELFVSLNSVDNGPRAGFDRNRFFVGPYMVMQPLRLELGYLGEYGKRFMGNEERMIHAVALYAFLNF
jgi:hypothetical protein